jgi:uncharacterized membrane protein YidH (DUF202 family)
MENKPPEKATQRRVHLANERTFLAWIRTCIAIIALGFVVERFSLFIREFSSILKQSGEPGTSIPPSHGYASIFGVVLVGLGTLLGVLSFLRYRRVTRQIDTDSYQPSMRLEFLVTAAILIIGVFLIAYLVYTM